MSINLISRAATFAILASALVSATTPANSAERLMPCSKPRFNAVATPSFGQFVGSQFRLTAAVDKTQNDCFDVESGQQRRFVLQDAAWRIDNGKTIRGTDISLSFAMPGLQSVVVRGSFKVWTRTAWSTIWRPTNLVQESVEQLLSLNVFPAVTPPSAPRIWPIMI